MALRSTQPLTELRTRNLLGVKDGWSVRLTASLPSVSQMWEPQVSQTYGPTQPVTGIALPSFTQFQLT
jgi:hypothetical protein